MHHSLYSLCTAPRRSSVDWWWSCLLLLAAQDTAAACSNLRSQSIPYIRASSIATANATDSSLCQHYEFVQQPAYKYNIYISFLANGNIIQRNTNMYIKFAAETNSKLNAHLPEDITARPSDSSNPHRCSTWGEMQGKYQTCSQESTNTCIIFWGSAFCMNLHFRCMMCVPGDKQHAKIHGALWEMLGTT
jgi:hypothetical protein